METQDTHVTITDVKARITYYVRIMSVSWDHNVKQVATQQKMVHNTEMEMELTWNETADSERGYVVTVSRILKQKQGYIMLDINTKDVRIDNLDECSSYFIKVVKVKDDYSEETVEGHIAETGTL